MKFVITFLAVVSLNAQISVPNGRYDISSGPNGITYTLIPPPPSPCYTPMATGLPPLANTVILPNLPQNVPCSVYPTITGPTFQVNSSSQLTIALANVQCGGAIVVQPGVYLGNFKTTSLNCGLYPRLLTGSGDFGNSTANSGNRIAQNAIVPWLTTANNVSAFKISNGDIGWYVTDIGFTTTNPIPNGVYPIVDMGDNDAITLAMLPSVITFDRWLITAPNPVPGGFYVQRGGSFNSPGIVIRNGQCWNIVNAGMDTQCLTFDNTPGPGRIENNYLEATGENIIFNTKCTPTTCAGPGGQPNGVVPAPIPSDFLVVRNTFAKQLQWASQPVGCDPQKYNCYTVKNEFEIKHGQRIWLSDNKFLNTFSAAQGSFLISNCFAQGPYVCQDWTITNNLVIHGPGLIAVAGNGNAQTGQRTLIRNNLIVDLQGQYSQAGSVGRGAFFQFQNTTSLTVDHNTVINKPPLYLIGGYFSDPPPSTDKQFQYSNNIMYGPFSANAMLPGTVVASLPNAVVLNDLFVGDVWPLTYPGGPLHTPAYPAGDSLFTPNSTAVPVPGQPACNYNNAPLDPCWSLNWSMVGMIDWEGASSGGNLSGAILAPSSPYHLKASDGLDPGANIQVVLDATKGL